MAYFPSTEDEKVFFEKIGLVEYLLWLPSNIKQVKTKNYCTLYIDELRFMTFILFPHKRSVDSNNMKPLFQTGKIILLRHVCCLRAHHWNALETGISAEDLSSRRWATGTKPSEHY